MVKIKITDVLYYSSQDRTYKAKNLLQYSDPWLCGKTDKSGRLEADFQLESPTRIHFIDIGNHGSCTIEIQVNRSFAPLKEYVSYVPQVTLLSSEDIKNETNPKGVMMFNKDNIHKVAYAMKWDRIKVICSRPYKKGTQYGLSFLLLSIKNPLSYISDDEDSDWENNPVIDAIYDNMVNGEESITERNERIFNNQLFEHKSMFGNSNPTSVLEFIAARRDYFFPKPKELTEAMKEFKSQVTKFFLAYLENTEQLDPYKTYQVYLGEFTDQRDSTSKKQLSVEEKKIVFDVYIEQFGDKPWINKFKEEATAFFVINHEDNVFYNPFGEYLSEFEEQRDEPLTLEQKREFYGIYCMEKSEQPWDRKNSRLFSDGETEEDDYEDDLFRDCPDMIGKDWPFNYTRGSVEEKVHRFIQRNSLTLTTDEEKKIRKNYADYLDKNIKLNAKAEDDCDKTSKAESSPSKKDEVSVSANSATLPDPDNDSSSSSDFSSLSDENSSENKKRTTRPLIDMERWHKDLALFNAIKGQSDNKPSTSKDGLSVTCPICDDHFDESDIRHHASFCGLPEELRSPDKIVQTYDNLILLAKHTKPYIGNLAASSGKCSKTKTSVSRGKQSKAKSCATSSKVSSKSKRAAPLKKSTKPMQITVSDKKKILSKPCASFDTIPKSRSKLCSKAKKAIPSPKKSTKLQRIADKISKFSCKKSSKAKKVSPKKSTKSLKINVSKALTKKSPVAKKIPPSRKKINKLQQNALLDKDSLFRKYAIDKIPQLQQSYDTRLRRRHREAELSKLEQPSTSSANF